MRPWQLVALALRYHWDAHRSNRANLVAATLGMIVNNLIVVWGIWAMLFDGKPDGERLTVYFLALASVVNLAWGTVCFLLGGVRSLGTFIEDGALEPMLATPRDPLLLTGIAQSQAPAIGDILQGLGTAVLLFFLAPASMAVRTLVFSSVSAVGFFALFVLTGSLTFFVSRGSALGQLLTECSLSLSYYPTGKIFVGRERLLLLLTPAAVTGVLPLDAVEGGTWRAAVLSAVLAVLFLWAAVRVFRFGLKRYQAASYVTLRA